MSLDPWIQFLIWVTILDVTLDCNISFEPLISELQILFLLHPFVERLLYQEYHYLFVHHLSSWLSQNSILIMVSRNNSSWLQRVPSMLAGGDNDSTTPRKVRSVSSRLWCCTTGVLSSVPSTIRSSRRLRLMTSREPGYGTYNPISITGSTVVYWSVQLMTSNLKCVCLAAPAIWNTAI